jgi:hypothetical protein
MCMSTLAHSCTLIVVSNHNTIPAKPINPATTFISLTLPAAFVNIGGVGFTRLGPHGDFGVR